MAHKPKEGFRRLQRSYTEEGKGGKGWSYGGEETALVWGLGGTLERREGGSSHSRVMEEQQSLSVLPTYVNHPSERRVQRKNDFPVLRRLTLLGLVHLERKGGAGKKGKRERKTRNNH